MFNIEKTLTYKVSLFSAYTSCFIILILYFTSQTHYLVKTAASYSFPFGFLANALVVISMFLFLFFAPCACLFMIFVDLYFKEKVWSKNISTNKFIKIFNYIVLWIYSIISLFLIIATLITQPYLILLYIIAAIVVFIKNKKDTSKSTIN